MAGFVLVGVAFALGVIAALTQTPPPAVVRPILGGLMIVWSGFLAVSTLREPAFDKGMRLRQLCIAGGLGLMGVGYMFSGTAALVIQLVALAVMVTGVVLQRRARIARTR